MLPIQTRLKEGGFLLLDGAMGTMLQAAQAPMGKVPEALNITHPELIRSIHQSYLEAGAEVIYANTFAANPYKVQDCPYSSTQLIQAGVKLAKEAGSAKAVNVVLLGVLARQLDLDKQVWLDAIRATVKPQFIEMNEKAFALGYQAG